MILSYERGLIDSNSEQNPFGGEGYQREEMSHRECKFIDIIINVYLESEQLCVQHRGNFVS